MREQYEYVLRDNSVFVRTPDTVAHFLLIYCARIATHRSVLGPSHHYLCTQCDCVLLLPITTDYRLPDLQ